MWGGGPEPCVTHPDVIEIVAQNVIKELEQNPDRQNISVSQNDNDKFSFHQVSPSNLFLSVRVRSAADLCFQP